MVREFTGIEVGLSKLGGTRMHATSSGLCAVESDDVVGAVAELLEYLPSNTDDLAPPAPVGDSVLRSTTELRMVIPSGSSHVRRARRGAVVVRRRRVPGPVAAMGRPDRDCVRAHGGIAGGVRGEPAADLGGDARHRGVAEGGAFRAVCVAFNLPIVSLVDTPGFLPGKDLEWRGMIRHGAELAFAYAQASVPRLCLIMRKAFGGAYIVMDSRGMGNDICLAWPGAEVAVMGASGAVQILYRGLEAGARGDREREYEEAYLNPWPASERGLVDEVIDPADSRIVLCSILRQLATKREFVVGRKHDTGPQ